jgi:hypothetical protein
MPLRYTNWLSLKKYVEQTYSQDWLSAIIDMFNQESDVFRFSEYEVLGNWLMIDNSNLNTVVQYNYMLKDRQALMIKDKNFNDSDYDCNYHNAVSIKLYDDVKLAINDIEYCKQVFMRV